MSDNDKITDEFPAMGTGIPVRNVSGETPTLGASIRHTERGAGGKFKAREPRITGPLNKPTGPGGIDAVTGQWISGVRDNSQLHDLERVHAVSSRQMRHEPHNGVRASDSPRHSNAGFDEVQGFANHAMSCPCLTSGGACCG